MIDIRKEVFAYLKENYGEKNYQLEMDIKDDLGLTSLDLVDLAFYLEEKIDRIISDEELLSIKTIGDVVSFLMNNLNEEELTK